MITDYIISGTRPDRTGLDNSHGTGQIVTFGSFYVCNVLSNPVSYCLLVELVV